MGAFKRTAEKVLQEDRLSLSLVAFSACSHALDAVAMARFAGIQVKQALGFKAASDKEWKPTSNDRNNQMVKEAKKFAQHIKALHADVSGWTKTFDGAREAFACGTPSA